MSEATTKSGAKKPAPKTNTKKGLHSTADTLIQTAVDRINADGGQTSFDEVLAVGLAVFRKNQAAMVDEIVAKLS